MTFTRVIAAAALCAALTAPLAAHHSAAMFDDEKVVELNGTIKEMQWTNPHIWIQVVVDNQGQKTEWSVEGGSPNTLSRNGWRSNTFKFGDPVTVRVNPMKDGTAAGQFIGAKFKETGKTIGRWE
ncbi:MAG TPA: DUF6152 family protein [Vicinamibacterales bacterium]|jgi:hypothetical protein|nr:DUF6152 family protein [Vicinamibacterales bacterium]